MDIQSLWSQAQRTRYKLQNQVDSSNTINYDARSMQMNLELLGGLLQQMKTALQQSNYGREWISKVEGLEDDLASLTQAYTSIEQARQVKTSRQRLLAGSNDNNLAHRKHSEVQQREGELLNVAIRMMDQNISKGEDVSEMLAKQKRTLAGSLYKLKDAKSLVELGNSVVKMIGGSNKTNARLTYACMLVTIIIVGLTYYYFRYLPANASAQAALQEPPLDDPY